MWGSDKLLKLSNQGVKLLSNNKLLSNDNQMLLGVLPLKLDSDLPDKLFLSASLEDP